MFLNASLLCTQNPSKKKARHEYKDKSKGAPPPYLPLNCMAVILTYAKESRLSRELGHMDENICHLFTSDLGKRNNKPTFLIGLNLQKDRAWHGKYPRVLKLLFGRETGVQYWSDKSIEDSAFARGVLRQAVQ